MHIHLHGQEFLVGETPTLPYPSPIGLCLIGDGGCLSGWAPTASRRPGMPKILGKPTGEGFLLPPHNCVTTVNKLTRPAYCTDAGRKLGEKKCPYLLHSMVSHLGENTVYLRSVKYRDFRVINLKSHLQTHPATLLHHSASGKSIATGLLFT